jgi:two-component system sensor histidine kinase DegS
MEFIPALESLVESLEQNYGIESIFEVAGNERDIPENYQISLIRVVQEALTNIRRHSKATKAGVKLHFNKKQILLTIEDNGRGFTEDDKARSLTDTKKLGIIGMRERIGSLGGTFDIYTETGKGTQIVIKLSQK